MSPFHHFQIGIGRREEEKKYIESTHPEEGRKILDILIYYAPQHCRLKGERRTFFSLTLPHVVS